MSDYPECDRLAEASKQTQPIGEFLDWLQTQGVQLMVWREDLTDSRPTDPKCREREGSDRHSPLDCRPSATDETSGEYHWQAHCMHWNDPDREAGENEKQGVCCYCRRGRHHEVTGLRSFVHERRGTEQLLADWAGIDLKKVDAERRQMLAAIRTANEAANHG
jgi:hypothetical protein